MPGNPGRALLGVLLCAVALLGVPLAASIELPASIQQGALVVGRTQPGNAVRVDSRELRVDADGYFVFGIGRDHVDAVRVDVEQPDGGRFDYRIPVVRRDWRIERVEGLPQQTVTPDPQVAARIAREQAMVNEARSRDEARSDFAHGFVRPLQGGRISGTYGSQRVLNGEPRAPHMGLDIAVPTGTAVHAPAPGIVSFAHDDLVLTGGTLLIDHGHGVSSSYLHLSRIDVSVGQRVETGERIGAVGATGRASGPHLHWGLNWFDTRLDPALLIE